MGNCILAKKTGYNIYKAIPESEVMDSATFMRSLGSAKCVRIMVQDRLRRCCLPYTTGYTMVIETEEDIKTVTFMATV